MGAIFVDCIQLCLGDRGGEAIFGLRGEHLVDQVNGGLRGQGIHPQFQNGRRRGQILGERKRRKGKKKGKMAIAVKIFQDQ